jgi:uncharacterized protein YhfF
VLPVTGSYTVVVDASGSATGQITMTVYDVIDVTGSLTLGQTETASLTTPGQRAIGTFTGTANQRVSAVLNTSTLGLCGGGAFTILKPDGTTLGSASVCAGVIIGPSVLPVNGTYTVIVDPSAAATGQVTLTVYEVVDVSGSATVNGSAVTGTLSTPGQRGLWTFDGSAAQQIRAVVDASTLGSCGGGDFRILKPDGTTLVSKLSLCTGSTLGPATLPVNGTYTVVADPSGSATGNVTLRVVSP